MQFGSGLNFHPEVRDSVGKPRPHLRIAIRPHHIQGFCVRGDHEVQIGRMHATARAAWLAVRAYCASSLCTATVRVFWVDGTFWRENEIAPGGTSTCTVPAQSVASEDLADCVIENVSA